jgi:PKD repeat protein
MSLASFLRSVARRRAAQGHRPSLDAHLRPWVEGLEKRELLATTVLAAPQHFDFGTSTSPVASGYTGVSLTAYTNALGYGWKSLSGLSAVNRNTSNALTTDFISGKDGTFLVNLPNGAYDVTPTLGDASAEHDAMVVYAEGVKVAASLTTTAGQFLSPTYLIQVVNNQLTVRFVDNSTVNPKFAVDALDIVAAPTANAGPNQTVNEGSTVTFNGSATGSSTLTYAWKFGDGGKATGTLTPTHTYADNGTYTVTLTVTDALGISVQATAVVTVNNVPPTLKSTGGPYTGMAGTPVTLTAKATDPSSTDTKAGFTFTWNFGDGSTGNGATVSHTYAAAGTFTVTVTATDKDGGVSTPGSTTATVSPAAPTVSAGPNQTVNEGSPVTFAGSASGGSALTYLWNFGDGATASGTLSPTHLYAGYGTYTVTLTATDTWGHSGQGSLQLTIINLPPTVTGATAYVGIAGQPIAFAASATDPGQADTLAGLTYTWTFGDGGTASGAAPGYSYAAAGTYTVVVTVTDQGGASSSLTATATVEAFAPTAGAGPNQTVNDGTAVSFAGSATGASALTYVWNFGDGSAAAGSLTPAHLYAIYGTYTATLTVTDAVGYTSQDSARVTVKHVPPTVTGTAAYVGIAGQAVAFTANASDPGPADMAAGFTYTWTFGDGGTASGASSSHSYAAAGTYTVTVTATDQGGASGSFTATATVEAFAPTANAGSNQTVNDGTAVSFAGSATGASALTYVWDFGDGATAAGSLTPTHLYAIYGTYTATLTVTDALGYTSQDSARVTVTHVPPTVTGTAAYVGIAGQPITFTATASDPGPADMAAGFTYTWTFGDGGTAGGANPSYSYAAAGTYTVVVTATDQGGASGSFTATATAEAFAPTASAGPNRTVNDGTAVSFVGSASGASALSYVWDFGDGATASGSLTPTHLYAIYGTYTATLTVSDALGYTSQDSARVTVKHVPPTVTGTAAYVGIADQAVAFTASATDPGPADMAAGFTYTWTFGDGGTAGGASASYSYAAAGTYTVVVTATDQGGASGSFTAVATVEAFAPTASAGSAQTVNDGTPVSFAGSATGASALSYLWDFGDGTTASGTLSPTHLYAIYGTYTATLTVTDALGYSSQDSAQVTVVHVPPTVTGTAAYVGIAGQAVVFTASATDPGPADMAAGFTYTWDFGDGNTASGATPSYSYAGAGTYTVVVTATDQGGASGSFTAVATVEAFAPTASAGPDQVVNEGSPVSFAGSATGATALSYLWDFGDGATAAGSLTPTHTYADNGTYTATLTATDVLGYSSQDSARITVNNVPPTVSSAASYVGLAGAPIAFAATATDPSPVDTAAGFTYTWDFGDGGTAGGATPSYTYAVAGTYTVVVTATDKDGGSGSFTASAAVEAFAPTANVGPNQTVSQGAPVSFAGSATGASALTYLWDFGDGATTAGTLTPTHAYAAAGTYTATLTVTDALGYSAQATTQVTALVPTVTGTASYVGIANQSIAFTASATEPGVATGFTYTWDFGDGGTASGASPSYAYAAAGTYTVTVTATDQAGASSSFTATATVEAFAPTASAGPGPVVNVVSPATFAGSAAGASALSYLWNFGDGATAAGTLTPTHTYSDDGSYTATLTVTDALGFSSQSSTTVTVNNLPPTVTGGGPYTVVAGSPLIFAPKVTDPSTVDTNAGFTFSWNFGDGGTGTGANPSHTYATAGVYTATVTVYDKDGDSATTTTTVTALAPMIFLQSNGVFAVNTPNKTFTQSVLSNVYVSGLAVRVTWNFLEPSEGTYNWSYLDGVISSAASAGKKVSLSVAAGVSTPNWVYAAGAQAFSFIDSSAPATQTIPVPWDPVFLSEWQTLITQLGARYATNPAVMRVKLTGVNYNTAETMLPISTGVSASNGTTTWTTTNDVADWQAIGYTRAKVEGAWQTIANTFAQAFPSQQLAVELVENHFPPIDSNGNLIVNSQGADTQVVGDLINFGMSHYGGQFVAQSDGLSDTWIDTSVSGVAAQVTTGYQMLWFVTGDTTYKMNGGTPISAATALQNAVNSGLANHAHFLEIYSADINNGALQGVLSSAQSGLAANALPTALITGLPGSGHSLEGTTLTLGAALSDPSSTSATGLHYAWTATKSGHAYSTGSKATFNFTPKDNGSYVISLTVTDAAGKVSLASSQKLTVDNVPPTASISAPATASVGAPVTFVGTATDPSSADLAAGLAFLWNFGDGVFGNGGTLTHTYTTAGVYTVTLTVTDKDGGSNTVTVTITVS